MFRLCHLKKIYKFWNLYRIMLLMLFKNINIGNNLKFIFKFKIFKTFLFLWRKLIEQVNYIICIFSNELLFLHICFKINYQNFKNKKLT